MSILIKGMEMPTERESYTITVKYNGLVFDAETGIQVAEAYELPPHGRLIDADALEKDIDKYIGGEESRSRFHHWVQVQSVVIPGNKGEQT